MFDGINGAGDGNIRNIIDSDIINTPPAEDAQKTRGEETPEKEVTASLNRVIDRVKEADTIRKERVHQVSEKLQNGELLSDAAIHGAADRIAQDGGF